MPMEAQVIHCKQNCISLKRLQPWSMNGIKFWINSNCFWFCFVSIKPSELSGATINWQSHAKALPKPFNLSDPRCSRNACPRPRWHSKQKIPFNYLITNWNWIRDLTLKGTPSYDIWQHDDIGNDQPLRCLWSYQESAAMWKPDQTHLSQIFRATSIIGEGKQTFRIWMILFSPPLMSLFHCLLAKTFHASVKCFPCILANSSGL